MASKDICPVCNNSRNRANSRWTRCDDCHQWYHNRCLNIPRVEEDEHYSCPKCIEKAQNPSTSESEPQPSTSGFQRPSKNSLNGPKKNLAKNIEYQKMVAAQEILIARLKELGEDANTLLKPEVIEAFISQSEKQQSSSESEETEENPDKTPKTRKKPKTHENTEFYSTEIERSIIDPTPTQSTFEIGSGAGADCYKILGEFVKMQMQLTSRTYTEQLDEFDGDPLKWPAFYTQYLLSTKLGGFDDAHNLSRLRGSLKGEAKRTVGGILFLANQLSKVIERLEKRFGGKEVIVKAQTERLKNLRPAAEPDPSSVRNLFECLDDMRAVLTTIEATDYLMSPQMRDDVEERLSPHLRTHWIKYKLKQHGRRPDLHEFIDWLEPYYDCAIEQLKFIPTKSKARVHFQNEDSKDTGGAKNSLYCHCCRNKGHNLVVCRKFAGLDLNSRWECVRKNRLCFICISGQHFSDRCSKKKACGLQSCGKFHHPLLHRDQHVPVSNPKPPEQEHTVSVHTKSECSMIFRLVPVKLFNGDREVTTWAFCDEGSSPTLLSEEMADILGLTGSPSTLCMRWTDGSSKSQHDSRVVSLEIAGVGKRNKFKLDNVRTVAKLDLPMAPKNLQDLKNQYKYLKDVFIPDIPESSPGILIGLEHSKLMVPYEIREGNWNQPIATKTRLGWSIHGKNLKNDVNSNVHYSCHVCDCTQAEERLDQAVNHFFTTESFGVEIPDKLPESEDMARARKILQETTKNIGNRFETGLLWKGEDIRLPDNRQMAFKRLVCFENKLRREPAIMEVVKAKIQENIEKGHLEKVPQKELSEMMGNRWYLPVFAVSNINKPNKVRLVYDAAAKFEGVALNDVLLKGPDLNSSLFGVLIRFRERAVGIVGDIEEMFHRVKMIKKDQQCQLILWRNCDQSVPPSVMKLTVMSFGATCSPCSAQYVKNENARKFQTEYPRAVDSIINHHFVDDLLDSTDTPEEAIELAEQVKLIHAKGGFNIRNWMSNSKEVVDALNPSLKLEVEKNLNLSDDLAVERVLGLAWDTSSDSFLFKLSFKKIDADLISLKRVPTKREMLKIIMSVYDPLGMLATEVIHAKILMQQVWKYGTLWDEEIPEVLVPMWKRWMERLADVEKVSVPRCYSANLFVAEKVELHVFADSSEFAFAAVAYLRVMKTNCEVKLAFVASKTRVAPKKSLSIPRLELQAAVLATRLAHTIKDETTRKLDSVTYWSDSQTVLGWIHSSHRRYSAFVSHRIGEILTHSTIHQWRWVPSKLNVADDATKWKETSPILDRWFDGPEYLLKPENEWPENKFGETTDEEVLNVHVHVENREIENQIIQIERFSKWERLLRATGFVVRFMNLVKNHKQNQSSRKIIQPCELKQIYKKIPALTDTELRAAERILILINQRESFPAEFELLKQNKVVPKSSKIYQLSVFVDDGQMKLESRLDMAPPVVTQELRNPLILGSQHRITYLMMEFLHRQFHHCARETVINEFRQKFWVTKIRPLLNHVINDCNLCKFMRAKPRVPRMATLPYQRLAPYEAPFTYTGMDYFGPLEITVGRRHEKRYGVIFTCLTMRAIHLELAASLDTNACVNCIRNFMNRRGQPKEILCDNGSNLKSAEKELKNAVLDIEFDEIASRTQNHKPVGQFTKFIYNPPGAPHFGGSWERMVGLVKRCLYQILKEKAPKEDVLRCALIEAEDMVNSRPLNYVTTLDDSLEAITPNHLLKLRARPVICPDTNEIDWRKTWSAAQALADAFWKRFVAEYIPTIAKRSKWFDEEKPLKINQLVLIVDENLKRGEWKRGIVTEVHPGRDGRIRSATVKTAKSSYLRPVAKLAVIDVDACKEFI